MQQYTHSETESEIVGFPDDQELLGRMREGDRHAFEMLYLKHWKFAYQAASRRLHNGYDAKDIVQDVFTQLWLQQNKTTATAITDFKAYLSTAIRNNVFKWMEKENAFVELPELLSQLRQDSENADSNLLYRELEASYHLLMEQMPPQQKQIFEMRFENEFSSDDIATMLHIAPKTVRNQIGRALTRVKAAVLSISAILLLFC